MSGPSWWRSIRLVSAWALGLYLARMYVAMGWIKFDPHGFWTQAFIRWGYPTWLRWAVGGIETLGGVMLLIPWLATYGAFALGAVMIGAWVTRFHDHRMVDVAWISGYLAALGWIAYEWRSFRLRGHYPFPLLPWRSK